jgi:hypothetical protein
VHAFFISAHGTEHIHTQSMSAANQSPQCLHASAWLPDTGQAPVGCKPITPIVVDSQQYWYLATSEEAFARPPDTRNINGKIWIFLAENDESTMFRRTSHQYFAFELELHHVLKETYKYIHPRLSTSQVT